LAPLTENQAAGARLFPGVILQAVWPEGKPRPDRIWKWSTPVKRPVRSYSVRAAAVPQMAQALQNRLKRSASGGPAAKRARH
jgi:hypothetical protein